MTEQIDRRADATRLQILRAASRQFAHKPYSDVSLDDILADAEVTKGAMYFHFRSKRALATAVVEQRAAIGQTAVADLLGRQLSGMETLIDISYVIATADIGEAMARAGLNLLGSIGRSDGLSDRVLGEWVTGFADIARRAVSDGDVVAARTPENIARVLVSLYLGLRQTSDFAAPERFLTDLENCWLLTLPGFANPTGSTTSPSSSVGAPH